MLYMNNRQTNVLIAIQARSTSSRLPNKGLMELEGIPIIDRVIEQARAVRDHIRREDNITIDIAVLVPTGDPIGEYIESQVSRTLVIYGSERNVLSRYTKAMDVFPSNFIVRLTADCPLVPSYVIYKHIKTAIIRHADYIENVWPELRTAPDGHDVEVLSNKALGWLNENVKTDYDREHVTTLIRHEKPNFAKYVHMTSSLDLSDVKLSIDTQEDFDRVGSLIQRMGKKSKLLSMVIEQENFERYSL